MANNISNKLVLSKCCYSKLTLLMYAAVLSLSGCASFYDTTVSNPDIYHKPQNVDTSYNIDGRFSIINHQKDYYGNFNWQHESDFDSLSLMSPLGNAVAKITVESSVAILETSDGKYSGTDLDELLIRQLGFTLPVSYLHYWVQGIPLPNYPVESSLSSGFSQLNWNIEYLRWQDVNHPQIVQVSNKDLRIKLLINWSDNAN